MKENLIRLLKWGMVVLLVLSAAFFFLPYRANNSAFKIIKLANQMGATELVIEGILQWVVPIAFALLSGLMLTMRFSIGKCIAGTIFCVIATILHISSINIGSGKLGAGIVVNLIIAIMGVVTPIVIIILNKRDSTTKENEVRT